MIGGDRPEREWTRRRWSLGADGARPLAPQMLLLPDHRIGASDDDARRAWDFEDGALLLRDAAGAPAARFDRLSEPAGALRLDGVSLRDGAPMVLRETAPAQLPADAASAAPDPVRMRPGPAREFLVILRGGYDTLHNAWDADLADEARNWDLLLSWAPVEPPGPEQSCDLLCLQPMHPTTMALHQLLHPESPLWAYRYIMICDPYVMLAWSDLNRIFARAVAYNLLIAQPARGADGAIEHPITASRPGSRLRFTSYVDRATPVFAREALRLAVPTFGDLMFGHGVDHLWGFLLGRPRNRIAILDDIPVTVTRPFAERYDAGLGETEARIVFRTYGLAPEYREYGSLWA